MKSIDSAAVLSELNISVWVGRKLDKKVSEEVDAAKHTKTRAGAYHKRLMADVDSLQAIERHAGETRNYHYRMTLPWSDAGPRLLPSSLMMEYIDTMKVRRGEFEQLVQRFLDGYDTQISAMAFKLGNLFDRSEYPSKEQIARKFRMEYVLSPVPSAGDFRLDIGNEAAQELRREYEAAMQERINGAMDSLYEEMRDQLAHAVERLGDTDGKPNVFRDSLVENFNKMLNRLATLNLVGDAKLDEYRKELASITVGVTPQDLRTNREVRTEVRTRMEDILGRLGGLGTL